MRKITFKRAPILSFIIAALIAIVGPTVLYILGGRVLINPDLRRELNNPPTRDEVARRIESGEWNANGGAYYGPNRNLDHYEQNGDYYICKFCFGYKCRRADQFCNAKEFIWNYPGPKAPFDSYKWRNIFIFGTILLTIIFFPIFVALEWLFIRYKKPKVK